MILERDRGAARANDRTHQLKLERELVSIGASLRQIQYLLEQLVEYSKRDEPKMTITSGDVE